MREVKGKRGKEKGKTKKRLFFFFFIFFPFTIYHSPFTYGQDSSFRVKTRAWPSRVTVGDEIKLMIQAEVPEGYSLEAPSVRSNLAPFEIKGIDARAVVKRNGRVFQTYVLTLTVFQWGRLNVPPVFLSFEDDKGGRGRISTDPQPIQVAGVPKRPTDKDDIRPIKGPVSLGGGTWRWALLALLALMLLAVLTAEVIGRRRKERMDWESRLPPQDRVTLELERLKKKGWLEEGKAKEYYTELADILRRYLERRYGIQALERTTSEILNQLLEKEAGREAVDKTKGVFEHTDLVKFAKYAPPRPLAEDLERLLLVIVNLTKIAGGP